MFNLDKDSAWKAGLLLRDKVLIKLALLFVGLLILDPLKDWWTGPKQYKIYLVGNGADLETQRVFRGVQEEALLSHLKIDGIDVDVERRDDQGNPSTAKTVAETLKKRSDTLMVV